MSGDGEAHLCCIHAMPNYSLVLLLRRQMADPATHEIQDDCILWDVLAIQLSHLQDSAGHDDDLMSMYGRWLAGHLIKQACLRTHK